MEYRIKELEQELSKSHSREQELLEKIEYLEKNQAVKNEHTWGQHAAWGQGSEWSHQTPEKEVKEDIDL